MIKKKLKLKWKIILTVILIITFLFLTMRFIGTKGIIIREYKVTSKIPKSLYGIKIVHFTDLHYGMGVDDNKLKKLVNLINETKPDIVFFTGDLLDNKTKLTEDIEKILVNNLSKIKSTYGNYYVNGDEDKNNISYEALMDKSHFKSLNNNYEVIYSKDLSSIFITGTDIQSGINNDVKEKLNTQNYNYKIFITHYPDNIDKILKYDFNLVLAGHSHNGQVRIPKIGAIYKPNNAKNYYDPYYKIGNTDFYISGGIGNSKVNLRLFNQPSFNLYRLVDK
jgi:predicted MPP superfamily phosphohydrolase